MRPPIDDGCVVVTGASSGIGRQLARELAPRAGKLVLVARRQERLEALKEELTGKHQQLEVHLEPCDLLDREAVDRMLASIADNVGDIDILVNNAGLGAFGLFESADWGWLEKLLELNIVSLTYLTHQVLPQMLARQKGGILNVSSGFGFAYIPGVATYAASKHYVTAFTDALRIEHQKSGVVISQLCPGPVPTEFEEVAGNETGFDVPGPLYVSAERVARLAVRKFAKGRSMIVPGFFHRMLLRLDAWTPRILKHWVCRPAVTKIRRQQSAGGG